MFVTGGFSFATIIVALSMNEDPHVSCLGCRLEASFLFYWTVLIRLRDFRETWIRPDFHVILV